MGIFVSSIVVSVMLSCNGTTLDHGSILYGKSKIQIVWKITEGFTTVPEVSYFLCGSWHTSVKVMESSIPKGLYPVGVLKTNQIIHSCRVRRKVSEIVIISYLKVTFGGSKALRVFILHAGVTTQEILGIYTNWWPIELYFC